MILPFLSLLAAKDECIFKAKKFFFGVDSHYNFSFSSFERAACCVFMTYFIFNLDYAPVTQITLESCRGTPESKKFSAVMEYQSNNSYSENIGNLIPIDEIRKQKLIYSIFRFVFSINPTQGNKRPPRQPNGQQNRQKIKYSTKIVHDDVARLINKLKELQRLKEKENSPPSDSSPEEISDEEAEEEYASLF